MDQDLAINHEQLDYNLLVFEEFRRVEARLKRIAKRVKLINTLIEGFKKYLFFITIIISQLLIEQFPEGNLFLSIAATIGILHFIRGVLLVWYDVELWMVKRQSKNWSVEALKMLKSDRA